MHTLRLATWWCSFALLPLMPSCWNLTACSLCLSSGHYDKCVFALREENKGDMANVLNYIFSHAQVTKKNLLVTMLIVSFRLCCNSHCCSSRPWFCFVMFIVAASVESQSVHLVPGLVVDSFPQFMTKCEFSSIRHDLLFRLVGLNI